VQAAINNQPPGLPYTTRLQYLQTTVSAYSTNLQGISPAGETPNPTRQRSQYNAAHYKTS
jgi:hypothetical protein